MVIILKQGDCLELMKEIQSSTIDAIICDLPYGVTKNKWDSIIPLDNLWEHYNRIIKPKGIIILFGQDKFTAKVMLSNEKNHKYNIIWNKVLSSGFLNANRMPMRIHEDIMVFYKELPTYNPQKIKGKPNHSNGDFEFVDNKDELGDMKYPTSIVTFEKPHPSISVHPTQKSLELLEWLIKSYTNENDLVLDNTMGSGTCGLACKNLNRNFIGYELDVNYFKIAEERINNSITEIEKKIINKSDNFWE